MVPLHIGIRFTSLSQGSVNITLSVVVPTTCIVVNNWGLNFTSVLLQLGAKSFAPVSNVYSAYYQTHVLDFGMLLPQDQSIQLFIEFTGSIQTNATGPIRQPLSSIAILT